MADLKVIKFEAKQQHQYDDMYQEIRTLILEKYCCFTAMEIVGILKCLNDEFVGIAMIRPEDE